MRHKRYGFTLIELLVVIAIIAMLMTILVPSLTKAKEMARKIVCGSKQKQWALAAMMYSNSNDGEVVGFTDIPYRSNPDTAKFWANLLAPYLGDEAEIGDNFYDSSVWLSEVRRCPAAKKRPALEVNSWTGEYDTWYGVHFGIGEKDGRDSTISAPFYYPDDAPGKRMKISKIMNLSSAMLFTDTFSSYVYSPTYSNYMFDYHYDDGTNPKAKNSNRNLLAEHPDRPYNEARPRLHSNGTNVALFDGHVEYVKYSDLWEVTPRGMPVHSFWYMNSQAKAKTKKIYGAPHTPTIKP